MITTQEDSLSVRYLKFILYLLFSPFLLTISYIMHMIIRLLRCQGY